MTQLERRVAEAMIDLYSGDAKRIQHFIKVNAFAKLIAEGEGTDERTREIISLAAYVHDIGIHESEKKYGSADGKYQEKEGPALAEALLKECGADPQMIERICHLVGNHHTYTNIDGIDYQILVEADFIVNCYEDEVSADGVKKVLDRIFKTQSGKQLLEKSFLEPRK